MYYFVDVGVRGEGGAEGIEKYQYTLYDCENLKKLDEPLKLFHCYRFMNVANLSLTSQ